MAFSVQIPRATKLNYSVIILEPSFFANGVSHNHTKSIEVDYHYV